MLYAYFGSIDEDTAPLQYVAHIDAWFDGYYEESWMDDWAERVISEVDKSKLLYPSVVESPWLGTIPTVKISGGAKQLIMAKNISGIVFNGNNFGDNCFPLLLELAKEVDIMMDLYYFPEFIWPDGGKATIINSGRVVSGLEEFNDSHFNDRVYGISNFNDVNWPIKINEEAFKSDWFDSIEDEVQ